MLVPPRDAYERESWKVDPPFRWAVRRGDDDGGDLGSRLKTDALGIGAEGDVGDGGLIAGRKGETGGTQALLRGRFGLGVEFVSPATRARSVAQRHTVFAMI